MRTRSPSLGAAAAFVLLGLAPRPARAQLDAERFKPSVTHGGFLNADGSAVRPKEDPWEFGAFLHYGGNQLVAVDGSGDVAQKIVAGRLGAELYGSVTLAEPFAIGVGLPFFVAQSGDLDPSFGGLGDLRVVPKLRLLDDRESIGLALAVEVRAPTHTGDFSGGTRAPVVAPRLIIDHAFVSGLRLGANVGATVRERTDFVNVVAASEFAYAADVEYRFGGLAGRTALGAELLGGVGLVAQKREELPHEAFLFLKHDPSDEIGLVGGVGAGIVAGYGVPSLRGFVGISYRPTSHDGDHDGVPDERDRCPNDAEDRDRVDDVDGCPEDDGDSDGIPDEEDRCPSTKETINGFEDEDGCPDEGPAKVIVEEGQIRILETVRFKSNSAELEPESHSILNQVALTMKANKQIKRVRVEGHTDETGTRDVNTRLSQERAESVRQYLINRGVKGDRLSAQGFGSDRPLSKGRDDASLAKNRRVEFIVEQLAPTPPKARPGARLGPRMAWGRPGPKGRPRAAQGPPGPVLGQPRGSRGPPGARLDARRGRGTLGRVKPTTAGPSAGAEAPPPCPLCERPNERPSDHHLVPKSRGGKVTTTLCADCHRAIHATFSNKQLEKEYSTVEALLAHEGFRRQVQFIAKQRGRVRVATARDQRRRGRNG